MRHPGLHHEVCFGNQRHCSKAAEELEKFFNAGEPPVCVGWAPMLASCSYQATFIAVRCLMTLGLRGIILTGAASGPEGIPRFQSTEEREVADYMSTHVLLHDAAPCEQLFRRCVAVLHPGSGHATRSALLAGVPSVIAPCFRDELRNAGAVEGLGCGVAVPTLHKVSASRLRSAVALACSDRQMRHTCRRLSASMAVGGSASDGVLGTIKGSLPRRPRQRRRKMRDGRASAADQQRPEEEGGCVCTVVRLLFTLAAVRPCFPVPLMPSFGRGSVFFGNMQDCCARLSFYEGVAQKQL